MSAGVHCGAGTHAKCLRPSCTCMCHIEGSDRFHVKPGASKDAIVGVDGQRYCEVCHEPIVKPPDQRGRYPKMHPTCKAAAEVHA